MNPLTNPSELSTRPDRSHDDLDRYAVVTDYDPDLDDLTREIAELRHALRGV